MKPVSTESGTPVIANWWKRKNIHSRAIGAFKTSVAAVLCVWLGNLLRLEHGYWAAVSAIVVMAAENTVTLLSCRDRLIGTAIGALLGWGTFYVWHGHYLMYGLAVLLCVLACSMLEFEKAGRLAAVTLTIIVLIKIDNGPGRAALARFLEVSLGVIVAMVVTHLVFPQRSAELAESASHS